MFHANIQLRLDLLQMSAAMAWYPLPQSGGTGTPSGGGELFGDQSGGWALWSFGSADDDHGAGVVRAETRGSSDDRTEEGRPAPPPQQQATDDIFMYARSRRMLLSALFCSVLPSLLLIHPRTQEPVLGRGGEEDGRRPVRGAGHVPGLHAPAAVLREHAERRGAAELLQLGGPAPERHAGRGRHGHLRLPSLQPRPAAAERGAGSHAHAHAHA